MIRVSNHLSKVFLGGGFKYVLFSPLLGEDSQFDYYFSDGLKPPTRFRLHYHSQKVIGSPGSVPPRLGRLVFVS